jgi:hypothetical protein
MCTIGLNAVAYFSEWFHLRQDLLLRKGNVLSGNSVYVTVAPPSVRLSLYWNIFIVTCATDHPTSIVFLLPFSFRLFFSFWRNQDPILGAELLLCLTLTFMWMYLGSWELQNSFLVEVEVTLRPTVSRPVRLGAPFGASDQMLHLFEWHLLSLLFMQGALSDERTGL